jgi:hypothetical protein
LQQSQYGEQSHPHPPLQELQEPVPLQSLGPEAGALDESLLGTGGCAAPFSGARTLLIGAAIIGCVPIGGPA